MKNLIFSVAFLVSLFTVFAFAEEIPIDISESRADIKSSDTMRLRNVTAPCCPGSWWIDFKWDPNELMFVPVDVGEDPHATAGIIFKAVNIAADNGPYFDSKIHCCEVDEQDVCTDYEEGLFNEYGDMAINTEQVSPDAYPFTIKQCSVTYTKGNENPSAPAIEGLMAYPNCTISKPGETGCPNVKIMDVSRKVKFSEDISKLGLSADSPMHYIVNYNCQLGDDKGSFQFKYDIWLADWDLC